MTRQHHPTPPWAALPPPRQRRLIALLGELACRRLRSAAHEEQADERDHNGPVGTEREGPGASSRPPGDRLRPVIDDPTDPASPGVHTPPVRAERPSPRARRALHRVVEGVPAGGDALREAGGALRRVREAGDDPAPAAHHLIRQTQSRPASGADERLVLGPARQRSVLGAPPGDVLGHRRPFALDRLMA